MPVHSLKTIEEFNLVVNKYQFIDNFILELGPLEKENVATITDTLTSSFTDKDKKARAIYTWIAQYIDLDPKASRTNDDKNTKPENVIQFRKSSPLGFALLFQEMCSQADIRCLVVDGYVKYNTENINNLPDAVNMLHTHLGLQQARPGVDGSALCCLPAS